jgi:hypothetical protein
MTANKRHFGSKIANTLCVIALSVMIGLSAACSAGEYRAIEAARPGPTAVYLTVESDMLLTAADLQDSGLLVVTSKEQLETMVMQNPGVTAIYFHPETVALVDDAWLQKVHYRGLVIVALNSPLSILAQKLGVEPQVDDRLNVAADGRITASIIHTRFEPDYHSHHQMTEAFSGFAAIVHVVERTFLDS